MRTPSVTLVWEQAGKLRHLVGNFRYIAKRVCAIEANAALMAEAASTPGMRMAISVYDAERRLALYAQASEQLRTRALVALYAIGALGQTAAELIKIMELTEEYTNGFVTLRRPVPAVLLDAADLLEATAERLNPTSEEPASTEQYNTDSAKAANKAIKPLPPKSRELLEQIGEAQFRSHTDAELWKLHHVRLKLQQRERNAFGCHCKRIRAHCGIPTSTAIRKIHKKGGQTA